MIPKFRNENDVPSSWITDPPTRPDCILSDDRQLEWDLPQLGLQQDPSTREHVMDEFRRNGTKDTPYFPEIEKNSTKWDYSYIGHRAGVLYDSPTHTNRNTSTPRPPAEYYMRELNMAKSNESCRLCKSNGELPSVYMTHRLKDEYGLVTCPVLQQYTCELCGATGPLAHTLKYCPHATHEERQQCSAILRSVRSNSSRRRRYNSDPRDLTGAPHPRRLHRHQSQ